MTVHAVVVDWIAVNAVAGSTVVVANVVIETRIDILGVLGSPCTNHGESGIGWVSNRLVLLARGTLRTGRLIWSNTIEGARSS